MSRPDNPAANELIGKYFPVLNNGFVALVDYMGTDQCIENAARVSYGPGNRRVHKTKGLVRYLRRKFHSTPFEMVELKFHCCMPMFVARQWIRHRTASVNEFSGRYSLMPMSFYIPDSEQFRKQSKSNRQGGDEKLDGQKYDAAIDRWNSLRKQSQKLYEDLVVGEVARELARIDLPLSTITQWYWKIDLHNLLHFLRLRTDSHAQYEIRAYANIMAGMVKRIAPLSFEAWLDYEVNSKHFSSMEMDMLRQLLSINQKACSVKGNSIEFALADNKQLSKREIDEFFDKFNAEKLDFYLDLSKAKTAEFFQAEMLKTVPVTDQTS